MKPYTRSNDDTLMMIAARIPRRVGSVERVNWELSWLRYCLYFAGKQHFAVIGNQVMERPLGKHEIRYKANFVQPLILRAVAKVMGLNGKGSVAPQSGSSAHRETARLSDLVADHLRVETDYEAEKLMAWMMAAVMGTSFLKVGYDPKKGPTDRFYLESKGSRAIIPDALLTPEQRQFRDQEMLFEDWPQGQATLEAVSSFQIHPDPVSKGKLEHCRWISQVQYLHPSIIAEAFNVDENDIQPDARTTAMDRWEDAISLMTSGINGQPMTFDSENREMAERAWLCQTWERPCRQYPRGRYIANTGTRVLRNEDNPNAADRRGWMHLPFVKCGWIPMPLRFWDMGLTESLMNPQFRYNESRAKTAEFERVHGAPATFSPKGSGVTELSIKPGSLVEYNSAYGIPTPGPTPQLPPEVANNANRCLSEMQSIASQSEPEGNKMPGQVRSGIALSTLLKDRDLVISLTQRSALRVDRDVARMLLTTAQLWFTDARLLAIRGSAGQWVVKMFRAADLNSDVRIIGEMGEMESRDQGDARLLDFIQAGALNPAGNPQHAQIVLKALKYHSAEEALRDFAQHEELQEAENRKMIANPHLYMDKVYPVMEWEDHEAHQRVLERLFNNSEEWDAIDPDTQSVLASHWKAHQLRLEEKQARMMQMMEAAKGIPGAKGQPSQPAPAG